MPGMFNGAGRGEFGMSRPPEGTGPPQPMDDETTIPPQRRTIFDDIADDMENDPDDAETDDEDLDETDDDTDDGDTFTPMVALEDGTEIAVDDYFNRQFGERIREMDIQQARLEERERFLGANGNGNNGAGGQDQQDDAPEPASWENIDPNDEQYESDGERFLVGQVNQLGSQVAELINENRELKSELADVDNRASDTEMRSRVARTEQEFGVTEAEMVEVANEFPNIGNMRAVAEIAKVRKQEITSNQSRAKKAQDKRTSRARRVSGASGSAGGKRVQSTKNSSRVDYRDSAALARKFKAWA